MKFYALSAFLHVLILLAVGLKSGGSSRLFDETDAGPMTLEILPDLTLEPVKPIAQIVKKKSLNKVETLTQKSKVSPKVAKDLSPSEQPLPTASEIAHGHSHGSENVHEMKMNYGQALSLFVTQNKQYPRRARKLNQTGTVQVKVHIHPDGHFSHVHLEKGCDHRILDEAAVELIKKLGKFKPLPSQVNQGMDFVIPIRYQLSRGS